MSDIYLSITETPTVVTLTNPLISSNVAQSVTVTNVVSVNVVTMPAITVQAAAPSVTTVAGTVTANVAGQYFDGATGDTAQLVNPVYYDGEIVRVTPDLPLPVTIRPSPYGQTVVTISGTVAANAGDTSFFVNGEDVVAHRAVIYSSSGNGFNNDEGAPVDIHNPLPISGTVTVGNSVTIGSLPAISGTVTANLNDPTGLVIAGQIGDALFGSDQLTNAFNNANLNATVAGTVTVGNSVTIGSIPAISGTVTANGGDFASANTNQPASAIQLGFQNIGGDFVSVNEDGVSFPIYLNQVNPNVNVPISGTVTAAAPNGTLTTRFGTPTTASSVFATSAVTNANRKYLLIQNVTTQSNVITVGIGFTPTTTQGIQLTAGAGITFESSYIPTGAVYVLSSVTASNFTILEA